MKEFIKLVFVVFMITMIAGCISQPVPEDNITTEKQYIPTQINTSDDLIKEKIRSDLIGTEIVYYSIAGKPITYNITEKDIKSIKKATLNGNTAWKVRIGEGLAWDYYYEEQGNEIIKKEQLFAT
ncbi:MAG: hypothetical protein WC556_08480 [Candidatus Methanoperedens sp.]